MICPEESDFSAEFRVIGCGHGAGISSLKAGEGILSWVRYFYLYPCHYVTIIN